MAYRGVGAAPRILVLLLLVVALGFGAVIWFDYLGLINAREALAPVLQLAGIAAPPSVQAAQSPLLLERERLAKESEAVALRNQQLDKRAQQVAQQEALVQQKLAALSAQEQALAAREKSFNQTVNQYDNRSANLMAVANNMLSIPPDAAVKQLEAMSNQDVIDILRAADQIAASSGQTSIVPYWLSLMPANTAAAISRQMLKTASLASTTP